MWRLLVIVCAAWLFACESDDDAEANACDAGDFVACSCTDGADGTQLCLPDGEWADCQCAVTRTVPCSAPGASFTCTCADGESGVEYCLAGGAYSSCDCNAAATPAPAGDGGVAAPETPSAPAGCPGGFSCQDVMGFTVCADSSGLPPFCTTAGDCAAAGLTGAQCIDPGVGGILVCAQECSL